MIDLQTIPGAIPPRYRTDEPNQPIRLYSGPLLIEHEGLKVNLSGEVILEWTRGPQIKFYFVDKNVEDSDEINSDVVSLTFPGLRDPVKLGLHSFRRIRDIDGLTYEYQGRVIDPMFVGSDTKCSTLIWHLANFTDTMGSFVEYADEQTRFKSRGRISLSINKWEILIDKIDRSEKLYDDLKKLGGYAITHAIRVRRIDGADFDEFDVAPIFDDLFYFLSFSRGFWVDPFLTVAYDADGVELWQKWRTPRTDRWQVVQGWFDPHKIEMWEQFWPTFRKWMNDELWGPSFKRAIRWYLAANRGETDTEAAIVLAQTAHELLTWTKFVSENKLTSQGFRQLPASDKLRLILLEAGISRDIPASLKALISSLKKPNETDGPQIITEIRNNIVHPSPANIDALSSFSGNAIDDAKRLTMWYLELVLLFLLGYDGDYGSRLTIPRWIGQTQRVPWSE